MEFFCRGATFGGRRETPDDLPGRRAADGDQDCCEQEPGQINRGKIQPPMMAGNMPPRRVEDVKHGMRAVEQGDHGHQREPIRAGEQGPGQGQRGGEINATDVADEMSIEWAEIHYPWYDLVPVQ